LSLKRKSKTNQKINIEKKPQIILFIIIVLSLILISYFFWKPIIRFFGWGSILVYLYSLITFWNILFNPKKIPEYWKYWIFGAFIILASIGFLGLFNSPLDLELSDGFSKNEHNYLLTNTELGETLGGTLGDIISREPNQWEHWENFIFLRFQGILRNLILLTIGFSICWPKKMLFIIQQLSIISNKIYDSTKKIYFMISNLLSSRNKENSKPEIQENLEKKNILNETEENENKVQNNENLNNSTKIESEIKKSITENTESWILPNIDILDQSDLSPLSNEEMENTKRLIVSTLKEHGVEVTVGQVKPGPTVTMYGLEPGYGKKPKAKTSSNNKESIESEQVSGTRVRVDTILSEKKIWL